MKTIPFTHIAASAWMLFALLGRVKLGSYPRHQVGLLLYVFLAQWGWSLR